MHITHVAFYPSSGKVQRFRFNFRGGSLKSTWYNIHSITVDHTIVLTQWVANEVDDTPRALSRAGHGRRCPWAFDPKIGRFRWTPWSQGCHSHTHWSRKTTPSKAKASNGQQWKLVGHFFCTLREIFCLSRNDIPLEEFFLEKLRMWQLLLCVSPPGTIKSTYKIGPILDSTEAPFQIKSIKSLPLL